MATVSPAPLSEQESNGKIVAVMKTSDGSRIVCRCSEPSFNTSTEFAVLPPNSSGSNPSPATLCVAPGDNNELKGNYIMYVESHGPSYAVR